MKIKMPPPESPLVAKFRFQLRAAGIGNYVTEFRFHPTRMWRFDLAWIEQKLAVEIEGGIWTGGRHTRGGGFSGDCEKYNEAVLNGWKILRFHSGMIDNGDGWQMVKRALV